MGDSYTLNLYCAYCGKENEDIWYAPSSDSTDFKCEFCGEENDIKEIFEAVKK